MVLQGALGVPVTPTWAEEACGFVISQCSETLQGEGGGGCC